jgi:hypothetical protein
MIEINKMIAFLYSTNKISMKYSSNMIRSFMAKFTFALVIFIWIMVLNIMLNLFSKFSLNTIAINSYGRIGSGIVLLSISLILNLFTWNTSQLEEYVSNEENKEELQLAKKQMIFLFIGGFVLAMVLAIINKG